MFLGRSSDKERAFFFSSSVEKNALRYFARSRDEVSLDLTAREAFQDLADGPVAGR